MVVPLLILARRHISRRGGIEGILDRHCDSSLQANLMQFLWNFNRIFRLSGDFNRLSQLHLKVSYGTFTCLLHFDRSD